MKKTLYIIVLTLCFVLALIGKSYGQGWVKQLNVFPDSDYDVMFSEFTKTNSNYFTMINSYAPTNSSITTFNVYSYVGDNLISRNLNISDSFIIRSLLQLKNGNYIAIFQLSYFYISFNIKNKFRLHLLNNEGEILRTIDSIPISLKGNPIQNSQNTEGEYYLPLNIIDNQNNEFQVLVFNYDSCRTNNQSCIQKIHTLKFSYDCNLIENKVDTFSIGRNFSISMINDYIESYIYNLYNSKRINILNNRKYISSYSYQNNGGAFGDKGFYILDDNNKPISTFNTIPISMNDTSYNVIFANFPTETYSHALVAANSGHYLVRFDANGNEQKRYFIKNFNGSFIYPMFYSEDKLFIYSLNDTVTTLIDIATDVISIKTHKTNLLPDTSLIGFINSFITIDNSIYCQVESLKNNYYIIKIDSNGVFTYHAVTGNIYNDANNNCTKNTLEKGFQNYTVIASKNSYNNYGTTDKNGNYVIGLTDSGNYTVTVRPNQNYPFWNTVCNPTQNITVENEIAYDTVNFAMKPSILCPINTVNVSSSLPFRIGRPQTYYVNYCNNGTILSPNTYITIKLDSLLDFDTATIPYTTLPNHTYRINIGNLDYLTCGNFTFVATPRIGAVQLNQTLCTEAHIYPDTVCTTPNYLGSYIVASAQCLGDSVELKLENRGGDMQSRKRYIVIEDQVMRIDNTYQLPRNGTLIEKMPADSGKTYRIIAEQEDNLPLSYGDKFATAAIEACRPNSRDNFSTGYFTQFPNYDGEPFRAMSCNVITGAYDPNDKVASPVGYATQHYIEKNTQIDYQINFQNTGNDTAFKVVVVDTIAPTLDINSIQLGVASHAYQFQRTDSNVVQFVFDNILLVDSFRNEPKSHGFVKFKIQQKLNNPNGTKIYNKADIYFDYNAPIVTNQTYHTVGQNFITVKLISSVKNPIYNVKEVKVFPNPFREKTQIIVEAERLKNPVLLLMNIEGKIIKTISSTNNSTFDIYREDLNNGIYLFKIMQGNDEVANGKVLVQ